MLFLIVIGIGVLCLFASCAGLGKHRTKPKPPIKVTHTCRVCGTKYEKYLTDEPVFIHSFDGKKRHIVCQPCYNHWKLYLNDRGIEMHGAHDDED
jgi:hypothetical protein